LTERARGFTYSPVSAAVPYWHVAGLRRCSRPIRFAATPGKSPVSRRSCVDSPRRSRVASSRPAACASMPRCGSVLDIVSLSPTRDASSKDWPGPSGPGVRTVHGLPGAGRNCLGEPEFCWLPRSVQAVMPSGPGYRPVCNGPAPRGAGPGKHPGPCGSTAGLARRPGRQATFGVDAGDVHSCGPSAPSTASRPAAVRSCVRRRQPGSR